MHAPRHAKGRAGIGLPVIAVGCLLLLAATGCEHKLAPGSIAPDFVVQTLDGKVTKLSNFRGRPVLLNLWATWCPPCIEEIPFLNRIQQRYLGRGLVVLGVAGDEKTANVHAFAKAHPLQFSVLLDPEGVVGTDYGITGYPESFLIDRDGKLAAKYVGPLPVRDGKVAGEVIARLESLIGS